METLNKYNTISNLSALSVDLQLADAVASFLTAAVERDMNTKFHNKLSLLEKMECCLKKNLKDINKALFRQNN